MATTVEHEGLKIHFEWSEGQDNPTEVRVTGPEVKAQTLRDLPWATLMESGRVKARETDTRTLDRAREVWPTSKGETRLAVVAVHFAEAVRAGYQSPLQRTAEWLDANPLTVKTWVARARKAGLLDGQEATEKARALVA